MSPRSISRSNSSCSACIPWARTFRSSFSCGFDCELLKPEIFHFLIVFGNDRKEAVLFVSFIFSLMAVKAAFISFRLAVSNLTFFSFTLSSGLSVKIGSTIVASTNVHIITPAAKRESNSVQETASRQRARTEWKRNPQA